MATGKRGSKSNSLRGVGSDGVEDAERDAFEGGGDISRRADAGYEDMYVCAMSVPPARATITGANGIARRRI